MTSRFKIEGFDVDSFKEFAKENFYQFKDLIDTGKEIFTDYSDKISTSLSTFIKPNGHLDARLLQGEWFPEVKADIFISHSRRDQELAIAFSGFLKKVFGLDAFVDSTIWHNVEDLQEEVDAPLWNPESETYNYKRRNQSTAYVHMLLSTALTKMIDNSEAIFFLSTPNSLRSIGRLSTSSAWIYHELFTANYLRMKYPSRNRELSQRMFSGRILEGRKADGFSMDFDVDLSKFHTFTYAHLEDWVKINYYNGNTHPLDLLYKTYQQNSSRRIF